MEGRRAVSHDHEQHNATAPGRSILETLDRIEDRLDSLWQLFFHHIHWERTMKESLDDLTLAVAATVTVEQSAIGLIEGLAEQIRNLPPSGDPSQATAIAALVADLNAKKDALAAAVTANTPAAPVADGGGTG